MASLEFRRTPLGLFIAFILALGTMFRGGWAQISPCPANATSCCQCITTPGCSWYYGPMGGSAPQRQPRCRPIALVAERPVNYSQDHLAPPGLINVLDIPGRTNRPINPQRMRLLKPQGAKVTIGLGIRRLVPIQVKAERRRIRLKVIGPRDAPEFTLERGDDLSCIHRFRVRERGAAGGGGGGRSSNSTARASRARRNRRSERQGRRRNSGRNSRRSSSTKQLHIDCYVSAPGDIQNLNLVVDMNRCYTGMKTIKVMLRQRGVKKTRINVESSCSCPCQSEGQAVVPGQVGLCPARKTSQACVSVDEHGSDVSSCSHVNNYCRRQENEPVCSGHGTCICSVCVCDVLPRQPGTTALVSSQSPSTQGRYQGWYCQCDNTACPWSHGAICGGPNRGVCACGQCNCAGLYRGEDCGISAEMESCTHSSTGLVCSGHGRCVHGACVCDQPSSGALCEVCTSCHAVCGDFQPCVECLLFPDRRVPQRPNCDDVCTAPSGTNSTLTAVNEMWSDTAEMCSFQSGECLYEYAYSSRFHEGQSHISLFYSSTSICGDDEDM